MFLITRRDYYIGLYLLGTLFGILLQGGPIQGLEKGKWSRKGSALSGEHGPKNGPLQRAGPLQKRFLAKSVIVDLKLSPYGPFWEIE